MSVLLVMGGTGILVTAFELFHTKGIPANLKWRAVAVVTVNGFVLFSAAYGFWLR